MVEALGTTTAQEQGALQGCPRLQPYLAALAFSVRSPPHPAPPRIQTLPPLVAQNSLGGFRVHYFTQPCKKTSPLSPPQQNESRLARRAPGPAELSRPAFCWAGAEEAPGLAGLRTHSAPTCSRSERPLNNLLQEASIKALDSTPPARRRPKRSPRPRDAGVPGAARAPRPVPELQGPLTPLPYPV